MKEMLTRFKEELWRPWPSLARPAVIFSFLCLIFGALVTTRFLDLSLTWGPIRLFNSYPQNCGIVTPNCTAQGTCFPANYQNNSTNPQNLSRSSTCPDYFRWIHDDLRPWKTSGITLETVMSARKTANFRLVIVNGTAYVEQYSKAYQGRDTLNLWGILQLLQKYPGKIPDLDLVFDCNDMPEIFMKKYSHPGAKPPPALFKYCAKTASSMEIVFPDWSFWGWPEVNIKPWEHLMKDLEEANNRTKWLDREPYAFWKGNPETGSKRKELVKCNVTKNHDWNARIYSQDWGKEWKEGFNHSDLASQCIHRYKIYIEGNSWSVSQKYILACDSVTLIVKRRYHDFFSRGLMPIQHYWPVTDHNNCNSIKFAVDWGNIHKLEAQEIGKGGTRFVKEELKMDNVYDYMFHLLNEYAKLLRYKPTIPEKAVKYSLEKMLSESWWGPEKKFMQDTAINQPSDKEPCALPPPFDPESLRAFEQLQESSVQKIESCERSYS